MFYIYLLLNTFGILVDQLQRSDSLVYRSYHDESHVQRFLNRSEKLTTIWELKVGDVSGVKEATMYFFPTRKKISNGTEMQTATLIASAQWVE